MTQDGGAAARLTMLETVLLGRLHALTLRVPPREIERAGTVLGRLGIEALAGRMLTELSGGQRRMVMLAQALAGNPRLPLLDETTAEKNLITVVTLHDLNMTARFADSVVLLCDGRSVRAGKPEEALTPETVAAAYGVNVRVIRDGKRCVFVPE